MRNVVEQKTNSIVVEKRENGKYYIANPKKQQISQEDIEKYAYVGTNGERYEKDNYSIHNIFERLSAKVRGYKVARYIKKAANCPQYKKEILREKAIKLLKKYTYTHKISKQIASERFSDSLGIYSYVHDADPFAILNAYKLSTYYLTKENFDSILKYIQTGAAVRRFGVRNLFGELELIQFEKYLEVNRNQKLGLLLGTDAFFRMGEERTEIGIEMGIFGVTQKDIDTLKRSTYYKSSELIHKFCDVVASLENVDIGAHQEGGQQTLADMEQQLKAQNQQQEAEQHIERIFNEAKENIGREL